MSHLDKHALPGATTLYPILIWGIAALLAICCIAFASAFMTVDEAQAANGTPAATKTSSTDGKLAATATTSKTAQAKELNVLFIGNSMTKSKANIGIPVMLSKLAKANGKKLHVEKVAFGGAKLSEYAVPTTDKMLRYDTFSKKFKWREWDYVVLQETSKGLIENPAESYSAIALLKKRINATYPKAKILLFMTYSYDNHSKIVINGVKRPINASTFQAYLQSLHNAIGQKLNITVVPVASYVYEWEKSGNAKNLILSDNHHLNKAGCTYAASAFYKTIYKTVPKSPVRGANMPRVALQKIMFSMLGKPLKMNSSCVSLQVGKTTSLSVKSTVSATSKSSTGSQTKQSLKFRSTNPAVASVTANGKVTAHKTGRTIVYAENASGKRATCLISVESPKLRSQGVEMREKTLSVALGSKTLLTPLVSESTCGFPLQFSSSDSSVARIEGICIVSALKLGRTTITAANPKTGKKATMTLVVQLERPRGISIAKATSVKNGKVSTTMKLTWSAVRGAKSYNVLRSVGGSTFKCVGSTTNTNYADKNAPTDKVVRYRIVALPQDKAYQSEQSMTVSALSLSIPRVSANAKGRRIDVAWNSNSAATAYEVYRAEGNSSTWQRVAVCPGDGKSSWTDRSLKSGKSYRYKVRSCAVLGGKTVRSPYPPAGVTVKAAF